MKKFSSGFFSRLSYNKVLISNILPVFVVFVAACGTALYFPSESLSTSNTSYTDLLEGRKIYIDKCGGCHSLIVPEKYNGDEWREWVEKMRPKTMISEKEKQVILKYLTKGEWTN